MCGFIQVIFLNKSMGIYILFIVIKKFIRILEDKQSHHKRLILCFRFLLELAVLFYCFPVENRRDP